MKVFRILNVILTISFTVFTLLYLIKGDIDYATFCAVMSLSSEYASDKFTKQEAK